MSKLPAVKYFILVNSVMIKNIKLIKAAKLNEWLFKMLLILNVFNVNKFNLQHNIAEITNVQLNLVIIHA
jgi:hypothetical protein